MEEYKIGFFDILKSAGSKKLKLIKILDYFLGIFLYFLPRRKPQKKGELNIIRVRKILVIRPGGIGDALLVLQLIKRIHSIFDFPQIDILCEKRNREVFIAQTGVNQVFIFNNIFDIIKIIFLKEYDVILDTEQWHNTSSLVSYLVRKKVSIGFNTKSLRRRFYTYCVEYHQDEYEMISFLRLLSPLEIEKISDLYKPFKFSFDIENSILEWSKKAVPLNTVVLFLKGSIPQKCIDNSIIAQIADSFLSKGFFVLLVGGKDFIKDSRKIISYISYEHRNKILNFTGLVSFQETAALIKRSALYIGSDTGLTHLAYIVGTPTIVIFGSGNIKKWAPPKEWASNYIFLNKHTHNSLCTLFGYTLPPRNSQACLDKLDVKEIEILVAEKFSYIIKK